MVEMAEGTAEFIGRAGRHGTEHGIGLSETTRRLEQAVQSLVHRTVAAHRHEAPRALGQRRPGEMRRVAWRLGEKRLDGAETSDEFGLDCGPALGGAAFMGGGIDDDRDLWPFPHARSILPEIGRGWWYTRFVSRAQRLLDLIQVLRRHRHPVSGSVLAEATGVSLRTLYRDIETLKADGAHIDGEAGVGYVLRPGFMLPPLMFSEEEIEALVLGSRWVHQRADRALADAAANVLAKIGAVLPKDLRDTLDDSGLLIAPGEPIAAGDAQLPKIRQAIRTERKLGLSYRDKDGAASRRTIWPFAVGFFEKARVVVAWCELRQDFRHFRTDRITTLTITDRRYPRRRQAMLKEWREREGTTEA
jgi:predicted DNA-binding transcriptional regulator YafY